MIYPKPYSIYLRGTITELVPLCVTQLDRTVRGAAGASIAVLALVSELRLRLYRRHEGGLS